MRSIVCFFFFNDTATTEIYTLSLHDALPIWGVRCGYRRERPHPVNTRGTGPPIHRVRQQHAAGNWRDALGGCRRLGRRDRKSTRLNSSHANISYAVFFFKKKIKRSFHTPESY